MALTDQLVAYYKMDDNSDSVGGFTLTPTNVTTGSVGNGQIGKGALFGSVSGNVLKIGTSSTLNLATGSISLWINTPWTGVDRQTLYCRGDVWGFGRGIHLALGDSNSVNLYMGASFQNTTLLSSANSYIAANTWTHIVLTWTAGSQTLYINGVQRGTATRGYNTATSDESRIGLRGDNTDYFKGAMDEFGIWSRQLSSGEVTSLYNSGAGWQYPFASNYTQALTDSFSIAESLAKGPSKIFTELLPYSDKVFGLNFDGQVNTYVDLPAINPTSFSIEAWIQTNTPTTTQTILGRSAGISDLLDVNGTSPGTIRLNVNTNSGQININTEGVFSMDTNVHHVVATFDASAGVGKIYVDGVLRVTSSALGSVIPVNGASVWKIGALATNTRNFNGVISGVRLWNTVLGQTDVNELYARPRTIPQSGNLIGNWQPTAGTGTALADTSGAGNNGTLVGGVSWKPLLFTKQTQKPRNDAFSTNDGNQIRNGDFSLQPPFVAAQTAFDTWLDGTAAGSATDNRWGWKQVRASVGTGSSSFQYTTYLGKKCMQIVTNALAHDGVTTSIIGVGQTSYPGPSMAGNNEKSWMIPVNPLLTYKFSIDRVVTQIDPNVIFRAYVTFYNASMTRLSGSNFASITTVDADWTNSTLNLTPVANAVFAQVSVFFNNTANSNPLSQGGTAYFTNVSVQPITSSNTVGYYFAKTFAKTMAESFSLVESFVRSILRPFTESFSIIESFSKLTKKLRSDAVLVADGNMVPNADFSSFPAFTAETSQATDRPIDGTLAGTSGIDASKYRWRYNVAALGTGTTLASYQNFAGRSCMHLKTSQMTQSGANNSIACVGIANYPGGTIASNQLPNLIPVIPGQTYRFSLDEYIVSLDPHVAVRMQITPYDVGLNRQSQTNILDLVAANSWVTKTTTYTIPSNVYFVHVAVGFFCNGSNFTSESGEMYFTNVFFGPNSQTGVAMFLKTLVKNISDTLSLVDLGITRTFIKGVVDSLDLADSLAKQVTKNFVEIYSILETFLKGKVVNLGMVILKAVIPAKNVVVNLYTPTMTILKDVKRAIKLKIK